MPRITPRAVAGMSLVELLVVVAIIGMLAVTVLPNLAGADGQREVRNAAAVVSSQLSRGPSLAIEQRRSAGIWLEPLTANPSACIDLYSAVVPPPYRGDSFDAGFQITPNSADLTIADLTPSPSGAIASMQQPTPATSMLGNFTQPGNLVQFGATGQLFEIVFNGSWKASLRAAKGQTPANTVWPAPPPAVHPFAIYRLPMRLGQPLVLGGGAAIDLSWSGMGNGVFPLDPLYQAAGGQTASPPRIALLCDAAGGFAELSYIATSSGFQTARIPVTAPVYLLVGRVDRCGLGYVTTPTKQSPGANWQSPDSFWIGIDPQSGVVKVTEVKPKAVSVLESQEYIRAGLTAVRL